LKAAYQAKVSPHPIGQSSSWLPTAQGAAVCAADAQRTDTAGKAEQGSRTSRALQCYKANPGSHLAFSPLFSESYPRTLTAFNERIKWDGGRQIKLDRDVTEMRSQCSISESGALSTGLVRACDLEYLNKPKSHFMFGW